VYDTSGRLSTVTDPENNVTTYTWNTSNRIVTVKETRNIVYLTNHYDANGRVANQRRDGIDFVCHSVFTHCA
jgi:YD repeat-containing protein